MRKALIGLGVLALLGALLLGGLGAYVAARLRSTDLEKTFVEQARAALGTEVRLSRMDVSFLSGVTLHGLTVDNPPPFTGKLMTAEAFVLRYRLRPLLSGRVEVERLALEKPRLTLAMDARGRFNYERLGGGAPATRGPSAAPAALPLRIVLRSLAVEDAQVLMTDPGNARLLAVDDANFRSAFELAGGILQGKGDIKIATVNVADKLFVRDVRAPLTLSKEQVVLAPVRGDVAGGTATGDVKVDLAGGFRFTANLTVKGAKVQKLLADAKSSAAISGNLAARARFEGKGGLATLSGKGSADIDSCHAENSRVLALLSGLLQVPELANPDFKACHVQFQQNGSRFATPVLDLTGDAVRLTGSGSLDIDTSRLDYQLTLALAPRLFAKVSRPELRAGFKQQADGFAALPFRLTGTTLEPKTDILARLGEAAAKGLIQNQVDRLFNKKRSR